MQVTVDTGLSAITGTTNGRINCFRGIPYGEPPVAERRFLVSEAVINPAQMIDATQFRPAALQPERRSGLSAELMISPFSVSEDCLYLNVWAPAAPSPVNGYPVLVWLHGGSAMYGSASQPVYDGQTLASEGIVVVTVSYRLGCMGFMELGQALGHQFHGSGNVAHHDQILALQWVQENISVFNGDAGRVTLAGESSGAKSVAALLASGQGRGLFHAAISASGGGSCVHSLQQANDVTTIFLQHLEQISGSDSPLQASDRHLMMAQTRTVEEYGFLFPFRTVTDGKFLQDSPQQAIAKKTATRIPLLAGFNQHDGYFQLPANLCRAKLTHYLPRQLQQCVEQIHLQYSDYPLIDIISDLEYILPTLDLAEAHQMTDAGTYLYRFNLLQTEGVFEGYCVHACDLPYIWRNFNDPYMQGFVASDAQHSLTGALLMQHWVNFIKYHDPLFYGQPGGDDVLSQSLSLNNEGISSLGDTVGCKRKIWNSVREPLA
ncbi:carboxylesterase/lipase family protein [Tatumella citrea]|uniref:Carboxylesterase type B domain-containing protein n=1 Tax=Tatumella citrea TaxID=53336 RepID=A0A1Y0LHQ1_TATCI|nr:carboxylesterase family protein [Tatumella citrea]ARU93349.1 hypothetical protein A7K98_05830 [Tatumella citrea]ARU97387.1 hypothetical protein A7K99_05830 [Tatumella citrea]